MEVLARLERTDILNEGPKPLSLQSLLWQRSHIKKHQQTHGVYFTPGYNPVLTSRMPYVMSIHDLIPLHIPSRFQTLKKIYFETLIKPAARKASYIFTVSHFTKNTLIEWAGITPEKIIVAQNGISELLTPVGEKHTPGYTYFFAVGNARPHKNWLRLLSAFANAQIDPNIRLLLTGQTTPALHYHLTQLGIHDRVVFTGTLSEAALAQYYRGALGLLFPSLYEGFGLPPIEAMACGTPVLTANTTALPEVTGNAALLVDPYDVDAIAKGIETLTQKQETRIALGLKQAALYTWDKTAATVQATLNTLL